MRTDKITVSSRGSQMGNALAQAEKVAEYKGLSPKNALHLRLLTEEMMGMMRSITGETEGIFWIEDEDDVYELHLRVNTRMRLDKRDQLLAVSTSGKNEAAKGLMGRLRNFFEQGADDSVLPMMHEGDFDTSSAALDWEWRMTVYQNAMQKYADSNEQARMMWDELEKSVVTHVADEIKVAIRGDHVEMTILKKMA